MSAEGFEMDLEGAIEFFEACKGLDPDTRETRVELLRRMVRDKRAKYISDPGEYIKGKRITYIKRKED